MNNRKNKQEMNIEPELRAMMDTVTSKGIQSICFFNNKGGVGKTTLVANLAAQLALNLKKRILVVDADPQCNLSQYVLNDSEFDDFYQSEINRETIYSIIQPLSIGKGYSEKLPVKKSNSFGFDLIVGDPRLALKEDLLAQDWRDAKAGGTRGLRTTFIFSDLIEKSKENYDFVLFDMGPSLGAINRSILLAADYFIVPMSIDIFSIWAVRNIGEALKVWQAELENGIKRGDYIEKKVVADELTAFFVALKQAMLLLPRKIGILASASVDMDTAKSIEHEVREVVHDALAEWSQGKLSEMDAGEYDDAEAAGEADS